MLIDSLKSLNLLFGLPDALVFLITKDSYSLIFIRTRYGAGTEQV